MLYERWLGVLIRSCHDGLMFLHRAGTQGRKRVTLVVFVAVCFTLASTRVQKLKIGEIFLLSKYLWKISKLDLGQPEY